MMDAAPADGTGGNDRGFPESREGASLVTTRSASRRAKSGPRDDAGILITFRESPLPVKAMLLGVFVNRLGTFIQTFLVLFLTNRGITEVQAGIALSAYGAGAVLGVLVGGSLSDRLGPRRAILISMVGSAIGVIGVLYVRDYPALLALVAALGAITVVYRPAATTLLSDLTPGHRQVMIMALYRMALNAGSIAGPLIGAALISVSYSLLFWSDAVAALSYAVIAAVTFPRRAAAPPSAAADEGDTQAEAAQPVQVQGRRGFLAVLADRRYVLYLGAVLINAVVYLQYVSVLPLAMRAAGLATVWYAAMIALNGGVVVGCELLMTKLTQRWPPRVVVMLGFALLGSGLAIYSIPLGVSAFVTGTLIWTLAEIVAGPTVFAYPALAAPSQLKGRYLGAMQAMFSLGSAIGPAAGVALWHAAGRAIWWWYAGACIVGMACARAGMRPIRPPSQAT
jgi:MFS family permease